LDDVVEWLTDDSGIMISMDDIQETVALYMQGRVETANYIIFAFSKQRKDGIAEKDCLMQIAAKNLLGKHWSGQNAWSTHARPESAVHVIGPVVGVSVNTDVRSTKLNAVAAEFMPGSAHKQTNSSWCAKFIANMTGISGGHSASRGAVEVGNSHGNGVPVGGMLLIKLKRIMHRLQYAVRVTSMLRKKESNYDRGFPCGMRPMSKSADSLINTCEHDDGIYLNSNLQTFVSKRMSHLFGHAVATKKVAMTSQGYVNIADLIKWLDHDNKVQVTMADITHIVEHDLKARYNIVNGQICAVNGHSLSLLLMTFDPYNHKIGDHTRYLVHIWCIKPI